MSKDKVSKSRQRWPGTIKLACGDELVPILLRIEDKDEDGVPENLTHIPDGRAVEITEGAEYMIVYAKRQMVEKKT